jgi:hypothetical protein
MKRNSFFLLVILMVLLQFQITSLYAADGLAIVAGHTAIFKEPAKHVPTNGIVDGAAHGEW